MPALRILLATAILATVAGARVPPCEPGHFVITVGGPLVSGSAAAETRGETLVVEATTVALSPGCAPVKAKVKGARKGTRVTATWRRGCDDFTRKVVLRGRFDASCTSLSGTIKKAGAKRPVSFRAVRAQGCGDGLLDAADGEECEPTVSPCSAGASCSACRCGPPPTTSTTLPAVGRCGDRRLDAGEECDDANTVPFDGCDGTCRSEQIVTGTPAARQTVATGDAASATDPFVVAVTVPVQGAVRIIETTAANEVAGYRLLDRQAVITAPEGEEGDPLSIVFGLDVSLLSPGTTAATLEIFWDDELVDDCDDDTVREASPDPCVFRRANATQPDGDLVFTVLTSTAGTWIFGTRIPPSTTTSTSTTSTSATTTTTTTSPPVALGRGTPRRTA